MEDANDEYGKEIEEMPMEWQGFNAEEWTDLGSKTNEDDKWIHLEKGRKVLKKVILQGARYGQRKNFNFHGEVCIRCSKESENLTIEHYQPLTFLRVVGFQRNQARTMLEDPIFYTNIYIILKQARMLTLSMGIMEITLLYEATRKLIKGRRATEYIALITEAIIEGNISNYDDLTDFMDTVNAIEGGKLSWNSIVSVNARKEMKNLTSMFYQYGVDKVNVDLLQMATKLKEEDDEMLASLDNEKIDSSNVENDLERPSSNTEKSLDQQESSAPPDTTEKEPNDNGKNEKKRLHEQQIRLLKARRPISQKEMAHQCCIFANQFEHTMYLYLPLIAHMIARGYFHDHIEIGAVADYLSPICGTRRVTISQLLSVINFVAKWKKESPDEKTQI